MLGKLLNKRMAERLVIAENTVKEANDAISKRDTYIAELESALANRNTCVSINREGRITKWLFLANGQLVEIETMGLLSDNVADWRDMLGIRK